MKEKPEPETLDNSETNNKVPKKSSHARLYIGLAVGISLAVITLVLVLIFWPKPTKAPTAETMQTSSNTETSQVTALVSSTPKLIIGSPDAKVTIIEYGDFKCPLCGRFYRETEPQIKKEYVDTGKINIEYRPLPIIAKDSTVAALGAYCAADQNKFELYHNAVFDYIYKNHYSKSLKDEDADIFTLDRLNQIATEQGLDSAVFNACMTSNKYSSAIDASEAAAKKDGVSSTPTVIIGTQKISGAQPFAIYKPLIEAQLR